MTRSSDTWLFRHATLVFFTLGALLTALLTIMFLLLANSLAAWAAAGLTAAAGAGIASIGYAACARADGAWQHRVARLVLGAASHRAFLDHHADGLLHLTTDGVVAFANGHAATLAARRLEAVTGRPFAELLPPGQRETAVAALVNAAAGESVAFETVFGNAAGGRVTPVSVRLQPVVIDGRIAAIQAVVRDLSAQRDAEANRLELEQRYRLLFDHGIAGILLIGPGGAIQAANLAARRVLRADESALTRIGWAAILDREDPRVPEMLRSRAESGRFEGELRFRRVDGGHFPVEVSIVEYRDDHDRECAGVVFRDLSVRKEASDEVRLLRTCIAHLTDIVLVTEAAPMRSPGPRIVFVNRAFERITGFTADEAIGNTPRMLQGPGTDPQALARIRERLGRGQPVREAVLNYRKSGEPYWVEMEIVPIFNEFGLNTHCVAVQRDITERRAASEKLEESEQRHGALFDLNPEPAWMIDPEGRFVSANRRAVELSGYREPELQGMPFTQLVSVEHHERVFNQIRLGLEGAQHKVTLTWIRKSGERLTLDVTVTPLVVHGEIKGLFGMARDVTRIVRTEEALRLAANALSNIGEAAVITDTAWNVVSVNRAFERITGFAADEIVGHSAIGMSGDPEDDSFYRRMTLRLLHSGDWQGEVWPRRKNGDVYPALLSMNAVRDENDIVTHFVSVFNDISRNKQYEQRLEFLAHNDPLTGLPNRLLFEKKANEALARAARRKQMLGLMFIDLDQFKVVNDSLGHPTGDALLKHVAERLSGLIRRTDTIARPGGDEFIIIMEELQDSRDAALVADALLRELARPFLHENHELFTSASVGISCYPDDGRDIETLLRNADAAMYRAKELGRNTYEFFSPEINARAHDYLFIANSLRQALDKSEFRLHYQAIVDLASGEIIGAEALLRWEHPERGMIPPDRFIPVAETTGIIGALGDWVLETACREARAWQDRGLPSIPVSVNLSARQFRRPDLIDRVRQVLQETGLDPSRLKLEITETTVMDRPDRCREMLQALHDMGIRIAMDDFGTGYSSLNYLKQFPFDFLKIDRSFVSGIPHDEDDATLTRAILSMARHLNIEVIAEGVETEAQREFLRTEGCPEGQGFLFTPALPAADFETLLARGAEAFAPAGVAG